MITGFLHTGQSAIVRTPSIDALVIDERIGGMHASRSGTVARKSDAYFVRNENQRSISGSTLSVSSMLRCPSANIALARIRDALEGF